MNKGKEKEESSKTALSRSLATYKFAFEKDEKILRKEVLKTTPDDKKLKWLIQSLESNRQTLRSYEKRIKTLTEEISYYKAKIPAVKRNLSFDQMSNHLKLKPLPVLEDLYERVPQIEDKINEMVLKSWEKELEEIQDMLKDWYRNPIPGIKIVQDIRSNMVRARVNMDISPLNLDLIIKLYDLGMLSRIYLNLGQLDEDILDRFGNKMSIVLYTTLQEYRSITVCINSSTPTYEYTPDFKITPVKHRISIFRNESSIPEAITNECQRFEREPIWLESLESWKYHQKVYSIASPARWTELCLYAETTRFQIWGMPELKFKLPFSGHELYFTPFTDILKVDTEEDKSDDDVREFQLNLSADDAREYQLDLEGAETD